MILLGDYIDRGKQSNKTVKFVRELVDNHGVIALKGNHEDMLQQWLEKPIELMQWYFRNGGIETVESYIEIGNVVWCSDTYIKWRDELLTLYSADMDFLTELPYYHEDDEHIYVHAGINPFLKNWKETKKKDFMWIRDVFLENDHMQNKTVIHGHTPTPNFQETGNIIFGKNKINIDGGCCFDYQMNCLVIENGEYKVYSVKRGEI